MSVFYVSSKGLKNGFLRLYTPEFYDIRVAYPPTEEQKAIAQAEKDLAIRYETFSEIFEEPNFNLGYFYKIVNVRSPRIRQIG